MADEIIVTSKSESPSDNPSIENKKSISARSQLVSLCALGLGVSFFLPWAHVLFVSPSGFDLQKDGSEQLLLWLIPIMCVITIVAGFANSGQYSAARMTGLLPFFVGAYWYSKIGSDLSHMLAYGAYLSLGLGAIMFVLACKPK
ncbi:MAG: hypothetical protein WDM80_16470 [Limisphaerales bacterium]